MTTTNMSKLSISNEKKEIADLKAKIAELEKTQREIPETYEVPANNEQNEGRINLDSYVRVMSLLPFNLNLSTKEMGQGSIKKFTKFGEVKKILYKDLVDIMEASPNFLTAGFYYILDPRVVRAHGLDETYTKILTKEKIEEILSANSEEGLSLYKTANEEQQKIIIGLIVEKLVADPTSVNLNVVDAISRESGVKIHERVDAAKMMTEQSEKKE